MDLGDVERRSRLHGRAGCSADLDDVTIGGEHGVGRHLRRDGSAEPRGERGQPVVAHVLAAPRQARILRDHETFVDELEEAWDVDGGHRRVDVLDDLDIG